MPRRGPYALPAIRHLRLGPGPLLHRAARTRVLPHRRLHICLSGLARPLRLLPRVTAWLCVLVVELWARCATSRVTPFSC
jgi:hypothetical protein